MENKHQSKSPVRRKEDKRTEPVRPADAIELKPRWTPASWEEQRIQYITRFVFVALGISYFNFVIDDYVSPWFTLTGITIYLVIYGIWISGWFIAAWQKHYSQFRYRLVMWTDVLSVSVCVLNDPFVVPLSSMVYIVVVLGNGMRYGMRAFAETLLISIIATVFVLSLRYTDGVHSLTAGTIFMNLFAVIILGYAYLLMSRIDANRTRLERRSKHDALTGLLNRRALMDHAMDYLCRTTDRNCRTVLMFADLDQFKQINDQFGHATGDQVLKAVGLIIRNNIRQTDFAARYGGDEFVLILPGMTLEEAKQAAERIQEQLGDWAKKENLDVSITIGIGESPTHGTDFASLLHNVDKALYSSKNTIGRGGISLATDSVTPKSST